MFLIFDNFSQRNECELKEMLTWEISVGAMEDSKCVAMGKRENILPFQIIQVTKNEKMTLPSPHTKNNSQKSRCKFF